MPTPRRNVPVWLVVALVVAPVLGLVLLFRSRALDPGSGRTLMILVLWSLVCLVAIPLAARWLPRRTPPLPDAQTYGDELREVTRSRREIVQAFEIERRRIERDLHDGTQQFIVAASMQVGEASLLLDGVRESTGPGMDAQARSALEQAASLLERAQDTVDDALTELRRTVAGIHPKVLSDMGLEEAVRDIASRSGLNAVVRVPHPLPTLPEGVVASAYFLVSEALTNVAKYAPQAPVTVLLAADQNLHVSVMDAGPGGAVPKPGHGLAGMRERLLAFGGTLEISSPVGGPTIVSTTVPLLLFEGEPSVVIDAPSGADSGEGK